SNLALSAGVVIVLAVIGIRTLTADKTLRRDLRGAIFLLIGFLTLRALEWSFRGHLSQGIYTALHVSWMLTFSFGIIRTGVAFVLWMIRLNGTPVPKILRDFIDFSLYLLV